MIFNVFVSHSASPREVATIYALAEESHRQGLTAFIPDRGWKPEDGLPERVRARIEEADVILGIVTKRGKYSKWVKLEMDEGLKIGKKLIAIIDQETPLEMNVPTVVIRKKNLTASVEEAVQELKKVKIGRENRELLAWLVIGGLLLALFVLAER